MNYTDLTEQLVKRCQILGADAAEVYIQTGRNLSVRVRNADIETVQEAASRGVGFRVFVDGKMGFSHCNDFSDKALDDTMSRAIAFARLTTPDENNVLPDNLPHTDIPGMYDQGIAEVNMDTKINMAIEVERLAMADPRITHSSGSSFGEGESEVFIGNTNGLLKSRKQSFCSIGVSVVAEKGQERNTGGEFSSRRSFSELEVLEIIASKAAEKAWEMMDPRMINTQRASVIFDPSASRSLIGGIIAAINGERVLQGASFLRNSLDQSFASALLSIIDDGTLAGGMGSTPFDGEGVPTSRRVLVENGVLKSFLYNTAVAKRAGVESTGNASRGGFTSLPGIGTHNLWVEAGNSTPEQIIANTRRGLLLKSVTGYGINPVNGNFSGGASGFWIENGKIAFPVKGLTIAGSAQEILNGIDMLGNDLDLTRSFTTPTIRIREMQIGGA